MGAKFGFANSRTSRVWNSSQQYGDVGLKSKGVLKKISSLVTTREPGDLLTVPQGGAQDAGRHIDDGYNVFIVHPRWTDNAQYTRYLTVEFI